MQQALFSLPLFRAIVKFGLVLPEGTLDSLITKVMEAIMSCGSSLICDLYARK